MLQNVSTCSRPPHPAGGRWSVPTFPCGLRNVISLSLLEENGLVEFSKVPELTSSEEPSVVSKTLWPSEILNKWAQLLDA